MPASSKSQKRLFSMALAVRHNKLDRKDVYPEVLKIVDSNMTDDKLREFVKLRRGRPVERVKKKNESLMPLKDYIIENLKSWED